MVCFLSKVRGGTALDEVLLNVSGISDMVEGIAKRATDQADGGAK